jgi:PAT family beta-lactamase induction signal transducer AmpG
MRVPKPWHFFILVVPFGVSFGFVSVALPYVARQKGIPVETISGVVAAAFALHGFKVLWAPIVDATLTRKTWYVIALALLAAGTFAMMAMPISAASIPALKAVVVASQVGLTLLYMACEGTLGRALPQEKKSTAASWLMAGTFLGLGVGGGLSIELVSRLPGPVAGAIVAAGLSLCALPLLGFDEPPEQEKHPAGRAMVELGRDLWGLLRTSAGIVAIIFALSTITTGAASALFSAIAEDWHASRELVETTNGWLAGIVQASGAGLAGWAMKRMDRRATFMLAGGLTAVMGIAMALGPRAPWAYATFTLVYNLFVGSAYAGFAAFIYATIGKKSVATKYNILASLMNFAVSYKLGILGQASKRHGPSGVLFADASLTIGGIVLMLVVIAIAGRLAPSDSASSHAESRGRRRPPAPRSDASRRRRRAASGRGRTP